MNPLNLSAKKEIFNYGFAVYLTHGTDIFKKMDNYEPTECVVKE